MVLDGQFESLGNLDCWIANVVGDCGTTWYRGQVDAYTGGILGEASAGGADTFLSKYDPNGDLLWTQQLGTPDYDYNWSVALDGAGNAFISGLTEGSLGGLNAGWDHAFLVKYKVPEPATLSLLAAGACLPLLRRRRR